MKRQYFLLFIVMIITINIAKSQGVSINITGNNPDTSAILDISSSNKGLLIPRLTTAERNTIINPAPGLQIYNTTTKCFEFFEYGVWHTGNCAICGTPGTPVEGIHIPDMYQIEWSWNSVPGAIGYKWNTTNDYGSATDNGTVTSYVQTSLTCAHSYTFYVWAYNNCGNHSLAGILTENTSGSLPAQPSAISGTNTVCLGQSGITYSVTNVPGTTYIWTYSGTGFNCISGCTTNSIVAEYSGSATSGIITCTPSNNCGAGTSQTEAITVNAPPTNVIATASPNPVCLGDTLSLAGNASGATSWAWTGPNSYFSTQQSPAKISITTADAGIYKLVANNMCGADSNTTTNVSVITTTMADAGPDQLNVISQTVTTTLSANAPGANNTGAWSIVSGTGGSFSNATNNTSDFSGIKGNSYVLKWTITSICSSTEDEVNISFAPPGWDYYNGSNDGTLSQLSNHTFTGMAADIMNNNSVLMYASTTANTTLNHKCYIITWDTTSNDITFTEHPALAMTIRNVRSTGNYHNSLTNSNFSVTRLTSEPGNDGYMGFFFTQEGTGGGNQFMNYNIFSYTTGSNLPTRLSSMTATTEVGTNQNHYGSNRTIPLFGRDRFVETGIGAGGYNYTDGVGFTFNTTTGIAARSSSVATSNVVLNNNRENFGMTTEVSGGVTDALGFYWGDNGYFMQNTWYGATHTTTPSITQTTIPVSGFSRVGSYNQNKFHQRIPGHLLNGSRRIGNDIYWLGIRAVISSTTTPPDIYFTNNLTTDMRSASYINYHKVATTHLTLNEAIGVTAMTDGSGNYSIRMQPINVTDPQSSNPTISKASLNALTVTDLTRAGTLNDIQIIGLDNSRLLILICDTSTYTIYGKIVKKP